MGVSQLQQLNVSAPAAYTEYSVEVPPGAIEVTLQLRPSATPANLYWYMTNNTPTRESPATLPAPYAPPPAGSSRSISGKLGGQTIYFQVDGTDQVLEMDFHADN